jgi:thiosulfate dehydrogenase
MRAKFCNLIVHCKISVMKFLQANLFPILLTLLFFTIVVTTIFKPAPKQINTETSNYIFNTNEWQPPDVKNIPFTPEGELIRYGRELIANTALYLGPKGVVAPITNGMNCQNCHLAAGTQNEGNCFSAVASTYPRYRDRSGRVESIEFRINDCLIRSLNGQPIDSLSTEMRAMVGYLKWLGRHVPKEIKPQGANVTPLPYLARAADTLRGRQVYYSKCTSCHGQNGEGLWSADSAYFIYPPLWGHNSYTTGAGLFRLSHFAAFVKSNMPFGVTNVNPQLNNEEAWDVAAFVNSQPRPSKNWGNDWPDIAKKPVDHPEGPYTDGFTNWQHKYGPFAPIERKKKLE